MLKKIAKILILFSLLASCSKSNESYSYELPETKLNPVHTAYFYLNLQEKQDRKALKRLLGVDPVYYEWCAAFVNAILEIHYLPTSDTVSDYPLTARSFLKLGEKVYVPQQGDIVVFPRGEAWQGHVGFYVSTVEIDGIEYYNILGGNQNNKVSIERYPAYRAISIRRVE